MRFLLILSPAVLSGAEPSPASTQQGAPQPDKTQNADRLRFTPSPAVRQQVFARMVANVRATDPAAAAQLETLLARPDLLQLIGKELAPFGLRTDSVADAMAVFVMEGWEVVAGRKLPPSAKRAEAVTRQMARAAAAVPAINGATEAQKQELAETLLVRALIIGAAAKASPPGGEQRRAMADSVAREARATVGIDLRAVTLTDDGLVATPAGSAPPPPAAGPISASPVASGDADAALSAALAAVPAEARPVHVILHSTSGFSGWPPMPTYTVTTHLLFANGWATLCSDWDPGALRPTPESLGRAYPDCGLSRWRRKGAGVELQSKGGSWYTPTGEIGELRAFKPGETIDIAFGNVGGTGFAGAPGGVSVGVLSGSDLRMTTGGEIAVGGWSSVVLSGGNVGGGSGGSRSVTGRYRLDGHVIATRDAAGAIRRGFIAGVPATGRPQHVYLNGKQFWERD